MSTLSQFFLSSINFTTQIPDGRSCVEGGFWICKQGLNIAWIVAPSQAEVSRCWSCTANANTVAQQVSGCTGWFVPTVAQLQNPGYICRNNWDSFSTTEYWTTAAFNTVSFTTGVVGLPGPLAPVAITFIGCVRSFRCVTF
jgi:hypothetical protein